MTGGLYNRQRPMEAPYTFADHAKACQEAAKSRQTLIVNVLAKRGRLVYCATLKAPYSVPGGGPDCWTIETSWPEKTRITVPVSNVIACHPEFCSCRPQGRTTPRLACDGASGGRPEPLSELVTC